MKILQQIFHDNADTYLSHFGTSVPIAHRRVIRAIRECRSGARGHHVFACQDCKQQHVANSSCGNRHCPVCQHEKGVQWVYRQQLRLLPCNYFLTTFTVPEALRACAQAHQAEVYRAMFDEAAASLKALEGDKRFVGCNIAGFFGVLHTWGRQIQYHPHVHFVVPGGGLTKDRDQWVSTRGDFLVHVKALSRMFRGRMKVRLEQLQLPFRTCPHAFSTRSERMAGGLCQLSERTASNPPFACCLPTLSAPRSPQTSVRHALLSVHPSLWMITPPINPL